MIPELGERAVFIWSAYGVSMAGLLGLALYAWRKRG